MALDQNATWSAGLKDGKVKVAAGTEYDINAIVNAEGDPQQEEIVVRGDDEEKATFVTNITEEISITANAISFDVLQAITGNNYASSATGIEIALGTNSQENPPYVELTARSQAKNSDGTAVDVIKTWHKVQVKSVKIVQAGESEVSVEMTAKAYQTSLDIEGGALGSRRVSTLAIGPQLAV